MKTENWNVKSYGILQHTFVAIGVLGLILVCLVLAKVSL